MLLAHDITMPPAPSTVQCRPDYECTEPESTRSWQECPLKLMEIYALLGNEFASGATSMEQVSYRLRMRADNEKTYNDVPTDTDSLAAFCADAESFFALQFGCPGKANLFVRDELDGMIIGLTSFGEYAWRWATDVLVGAGVFKRAALPST